MSKSICSACDGKGIRQFLRVNDTFETLSCSSCEGTGFDCDLTNEIVCPYCGEEFCDSWEKSANCSDGDEIGVECYECGKEFKVIYNLSVSYTSIKED